MLIQLFMIGKLTMLIKVKAKKLINANRTAKDNAITTERITPRPQSLFAFNAGSATRTTKTQEYNYIYQKVPQPGTVEVQTVEQSPDASLDVRPPPEMTSAHYEIRSEPDLRTSFLLCRPLSPHSMISSFLSLVV